MIIQPIVEGQGEVGAVPLLLRRLRNEAQCWGLEVGRPHRRRRSELVKKDSLQSAVEVAALTDCTSILVLFDADDDCPRDLAPQLEDWVREAANSKPSAVVLANREYEAWFLASIETLRGKSGIREDALAHEHPESPRGAREQLEHRMRDGASYSSAVDQPALTAHLDLEQTYRRCRSFRRLVRAFGQLAHATGATISDWPPSAWSV